MVSEKFFDAPPPQRRVVLIGASNLSRGLPTLIELARRGWREPLDVVAAPGRGRSYGLTSRLLGRQLPSLTTCGLWSALDAGPRLPTSALVTDVGNDIVYGVPVEQLLRWVEEVLDRLRRHEAQTTVTSLPLAALSGLSPGRYKVLRSLIFPGFRITLAEALERAQAVDAGLRRLAERYGATFVEARGAWYGIDPIHIRRPHWSAAWGEIVSTWQPPHGIERVRVAPWTWFASQLQQPAERRLWGFTQRRLQPSATLADGTRVSIY